MTTHLKALSRISQILDSNFPAGLFVYSFGLEPHILKDKVTDAVSLKKYLQNLIIDQYSKCEWMGVKKMYQFLEKKNLYLIKKLDLEVSAFLTYEYAKASKAIGKNYYLQISSLAGRTIVKKYFELVKNNQAPANELVVLSSYAYDLGIDFNTFLVMWTKKNLCHIAMTALKVSRITPSSIQKILFELDDFMVDQVKNIKANKMTNFNPLFEEVIFEHKHLQPKMFVT